MKNKVPVINFPLVMKDNNLKLNKMKIIANQAVSI